MQAHLRGIRISPKKLNIVAGLLRGKSASDAMAKIRFIPKKASQPLYKTLKSAIANAENNDGMKVEDLQIDQIVVNKGAFMKRYLPSTRGRALPLHKPTAHLSIYLTKK